MRDFMRNSDFTVNLAIIYNLYDMIAINQLMLDIFFLYLFVSPYYIFTCSCSFHLSLTF